jgi:hypothetical protein
MITRRALIGSALFSPFISKAYAVTQVPVDVALILLVDVSSSVNVERYAIQKSGIVQALRSPEFAHVLKNSITGRFALNYIEWSTLQKSFGGWHLIDIENKQSIENFAGMIETSIRFQDDQTYMSRAMTFAYEQFKNCGYVPMRYVLDVSGDGKDASYGVTSDLTLMLLHQIRDQMANEGVTINGLPIIDPAPHSDGPTIVEYYRDNVVAGPGAQLFVADSFEQFGEVFLRKLVTELG